VNISPSFLPNHLFQKLLASNLKGADITSVFSFSSLAKFSTTTGALIFSSGCSTIEASAEL